MKIKIMVSSLFLNLLPLIINNFFFSHSLSLLSVVSFLDKKKVNKKGKETFLFLHPIKGCFYFLFQHDTKGTAIGKDRENWVLIVGLLI